LVVGFRGCRYEHPRFWHAYAHVFARVFVGVRLAFTRPNQIIIPTRRERSWSLFMSARQRGPYDEVARKWHALAVRRLAHVEDLRDSGRWRHYYECDGLIEALREAVAARDTWARLAGLPPHEIAAPADAVLASEPPDDWLDAELFRKAG
jgi:hypothetical protein